MSSTVPHPHNPKYKKTPKAIDQWTNENDRRYKEKDETFGFQTTKRDNDGGGGRQNRSSSRRLLLIGGTAHLAVGSSVRFKSILAPVIPIVQFCDGHTLQANAWFNLSWLALATRLPLGRRGCVHVMRIRVHRSKRAELVLRGQAHAGVNGWCRSGTIRSSSRARVVLRSTPGETDTRVSDRITLHLVDRHLCRVALHKLNKTATFAGGNLDISNFAKALEEGTEFVFRHITTQSTHKHSRIVRIRELIHGLRAAVVSERQSHGSHHHSVVGHDGLGIAIVLGDGGADSHRSVSAVDSLHFGQSAVSFRFIAESHKAVTTGLAGHGIGHDLGGLARLVSNLEERDEHVLGDFWAEITDKDAVFGASIVATILQASAAGPIQFECTIGIGDRGSVVGQGLCSGLRTHEIDEAVSSVVSTTLVIIYDTSSIPSEFITDHLHVDLFAHIVPDSSDVTFVNPRFQFSHPK